MTTLRLFLFLAILAPSAALAGAWPRGEGNVFTALSLESTYDRSALTWDDPEEEPPLARNYLKFFAEYGLTPRYTLGIELEQDYLFTQRQGIAFVTGALSPAGAPTQIAVELGVGQRNGRFGENGSEDSEPLLRPAFYLGHGFETRFGPGWTAADLKTEYRVDTEESVYKLDLTLGVRPDDRTLYYVQLQNNKYPNTDFAVRLLASRVSQLNRFMWLETGLIAGLKTDDSFGIKIGIWAEF